MRRHGWLRCSFCGRDEGAVAKLVAGPRALFIGPRVHICDRCVGVAQAVMEESGVGVARDEHQARPDPSC